MPTNPLDSLSPQTRTILARFVFTPLSLLVALWAILQLVGHHWYRGIDGLVGSYGLFVLAHRLSPPSDPDAAPAPDEAETEGRPEHD